MKIFKLVLFALVLQLNSCNKEGISINIDGFILDESASISIENATITAYGQDPESNDYIFLSSTTSGANGYFSLSLNRDRYTSIKIEGTKSNYFTTSIEKKLSEYNTEHGNFIKLSTTAKAWARIHVINQPPNSSSDAIRLIKQKGKSGCDECCSSNELILNGIVDTTYYCINDGNTAFSIFYEVIGGTTVNITEINTPAFDTTDILISY